MGCRDLQGATRNQKEMPKKKATHPPESVKKESELNLIQNLKKITTGVGGARYVNTPRKVLSWDHSLTPTLEYTGQIPKSNLG